MRWQKRARLVVAVAALAVVAGVAFTYRQRAPAPVAASPVRTDPGAVVEVTGGSLGRFKFSRQDIRVDCEKQLVYEDGSTTLLGVTIVTEERAGRVFTVKSKEGKVGQNQSAMELNGNVQLSSSDGMMTRTEHATYSGTDGMVHATGPVEFSRGHMTGSGVGMTYDTMADVLSILEQAVVHVAPDDKGAGAMEIAAGKAVFAKREHYLSFEGAVKLQRAGEIVDSDSVLATLSEDDSHVQAMALRGHSRVAMAKPTAGGLQALNSRDMDIKYGADGQTLEHALLLDDAAIFLAGAPGSTGRQITAKTIDVTLAADGATPQALLARETVQLMLPAEASLPMRTIRSTTMRADGQAGKGLTHAEFTGAVEYGERGSGVSRTVTATTLEVALKPAMAGIDDAKFAHAVRFVDGTMIALAAAAGYSLDRGVLNLSGSEPAALRPRMVNDKISVDATQIDVTLAGPKVVASGAIKSVLQPAKAGRGGSAASDARLPSMFKQDKPVNVIGDALDYDGAANKAVYTGNAQLWQDETSVKGKTILIDDKTGDLTASGGVATVTVRDEVDANRKTQRVRTVARAADFHYEDAMHRATYLGSAHMTGPTGDMTANKIELYLKSSGDELDRAEAYENVTLKDQNRTTTGARLTYTTADERYVVTGVPVKVIDACQRTTSGKTLTYLKSSETITMDGNEQTRTQTTGNGQCP